MLPQSILVLLFLLFSCAQNKVTSPSHPLNVDPSEYLKLCNNNVPIGCYFYAQHLLSEKKNDQAQIYLEVSCKKNHIPSCTNLGIIYHQKKDSASALKISKDACLRGDALGCYNSACFLCLKNMPDESLIYLEKSFHLGYQDPEWALKDTDLLCLKNNVKFKSWIEKIESSKEQQRISPYHINIDAWGISFIPPQKLKSNFSHPLEFSHESQAKASIAVTSIDATELKTIIYNSLLNLKNQVKNLKEIENTEKLHNGSPYYLNHSTYDLKNQKWHYIQIITGTNHHTFYAWGLYPEELDAEIGSQIKLVLYNIILHPEYRTPAQKPLILPPQGYSFAGISLQNELIYQKGSSPLKLDGSTPYFTITKNMYGLDLAPLNIEKGLGYFNQILPPYYTNPILINREERPYKKGKLVHFKGTLGFFNELPSTLQFDFYLVQIKNEIYTIKFFSNSSNPIKTEEINFIIKQL